MIQKYNGFFTHVFEVVMAPLDRLGDFWGILFLSIASSLIVLVVYRHISSPLRIRHAKDQIKASILAIRMYRDFWRVTLSSFLRSLFYTFKYFILNFAPLLLILPILVPVFAQMEVRYGMRPFTVGDTLIVKARVDEGAASMDLTLDESAGFSPAMAPVVVKALNEENWKLRIEKEGFHEIRLRGTDFSVGKSLVAGKYIGALSNRRYARSNWAHFIYPVESLFHEPGPVRSIALKYPGKRIEFLGTRIHWIWHYLVLMLIIVLGLRKRFGVEF